MENGSCNVENGSVKWKMEVGKWKSETRSGMAPIGHGTSQRLVWLGFVVDVGLGQIEVPKEKIEVLCSAIHYASQAKHIRA